jgi:Flp pilus assembly protein TadG
MKTRPEKGWTMQKKDAAQLVRRFAKDRKGNIAVTFALSFLPVMGMVGSAMDYGQLTNARTAMKQASDLTAISLAKVAPTKTAAELQTMGDAYYRSTLSYTVSNLVVTTTFNKDEGGVTVAATADVPMAVMKTVGIDKMSTSVRSKAGVGGARMRVALVIDVTGSMDSDGKIEATKPATKDLIDQLKQAGSNNGDVYVSLVPFNKDVGIGTSNVNASWLNWDQWEQKNGDCYDSRGRWKDKNSKSSCRSAGYNWTPEPKSKWAGCVMDRNQNWDTTAAIPTATDTTSYFEPENYGDCNNQLTQLTNDFDGLKTKVDNLVTGGMTNQAIGFVWGWQTLVGGAGMTVPPEESGFKYEYIIVHMSDGLNTRNRWYSDSDDIDARQKIACDNAKASGIIIWTVHVNTGGDPDAEALKYCASDDKKFTIAKNGDQIKAAFDKIGGGYNRARLSE